MPTATTVFTTASAIYSPKKKEARRICSWGSRLFPHGLPKNARRIFPGQSDLFEKEKGCQVTKPGQNYAPISPAAPPPSPPPMPDGKGDEENGAAGPGKQVYSGPVIAAFGPPFPLPMSPSN